MESDSYFFSVRVIDVVDVCSLGCRDLYVELEFALYRFCGILEHYVVSGSVLEFCAIESGVSLACVGAIFRFVRNFCIFLFEMVL